MRSVVHEVEQKVNRLQEQTRLWAERGMDEQIFIESDLELVKSIRQHTPDQLFGVGKERPLVVAFFGGTGVGKSSLLNRFADQQIARVGIERPTSREVTLYLHQEIEITTLPKDFPLHKINIRQHTDARNRDVLWMDMPDIDSVETDNLDTVKEWIPYIDVLVYVVSPERYRDERGWRYLLEHGYQHAWLFVINQWDLLDQGCDEINTDFEEILARVGFKDPLIFRTDCLNGTNKDDFKRLRETLLEVSDEHNLEEIERRGFNIRLQSLQQVLEALVAKLGTKENFDQLQQFQQQNWSEVSSEIQSHLILPMQQLAAKYNSPTNSMFKLIGLFQKNKVEDEDGSEVQHLDQKLVGDLEGIWDDWVQAKIHGALNKLTWQAENLKLPTKTIKLRLQRLRSVNRERVESRLKSGLQEGLANPGTRLQRFFYHTFGILGTVLPVVALVWVAYRVVSVFSNEATQEYLGANFAIHSALLVLLAWIIPFLLHRKLQPSLVKAAKNGLNNGLEDALTEIDAEVSETLQQVKELQNDLFNRGEKLIADCKAKNTSEEPIDQETLTRMLQKELQGEDSLPKIGGV